MKVAMGHISEVVEALLRSKSWRATRFFNKGKQVIRATRRLVKGVVENKNGETIVLSIGKTNYAEKKMLASLRKQKKSVEGIVLKEVPVRREKKTKSKSNKK